MSQRKILPIMLVSLAFAFASGISTTADAHKSKKKEPMVLETMGVFWAGGQVVDRTDPALAGNKTLLGAAYVEYFIPKEKRRNAIPVIMTHSSISGVVFQTTGDGREGWVQYFLRQGFPVYVIDPPRTGRSGFDVDQANLAATGQIAPLASNPLSRSGSESWAGWNIGTEFGVLGSGLPGGQGNQMSTDPEALRRFLAAQMPRGPSTGDDVSPFIDVLEKTGPAIFIGWSAGGRLGQELAVARPDLFEAMINLEPPSASCVGPPADNPPVDPTLVATLVDNDIPFLNVNGTTGHSNRTGVAHFICQALVDSINNAGGDATLINLPDLGLLGDSHMYFWENRSDRIAGIVVDWIKDNVETKHKKHRKHARHGRH